MEPGDEFLKIYNSPEETLAFYPESVLQLSGGGYLYISAVKDETSDIEYPSTQVVRTNAAGVVEWSQSYDWLAPASDLILDGGSALFVAMDPQLNAYAVLIDPATGECNSAARSRDDHAPVCLQGSAGKPAGTGL